MIELIAQVTFKCFVECSECEERFDALLTDCNDESFITHSVLDVNTPHNGVEFDVVCPECKSELNVHGVEW